MLNDYALPDAEDFIGLRHRLKAPMDLSGVPKPLQRPLINRLIDDFGDRLQAFANANAGVTFIRSAGTLTDNDWANELHPRPSSFERLAKQCWKAPLTTALL